MLLLLLLLYILPMLGDYRVYLGMMEKKMETTTIGYILWIYRDGLKERLWGAKTRRSAHDQSSLFDAH